MPSKNEVELARQFCVKQLGTGYQRGVLWFLRIIAETLVEIRDELKEEKKKVGRGESLRGEQCQGRGEKSMREATKQNS